MSVREFVGARYVPEFADPLAWDSTRTYEPLTVVSYQGNSFTSRQYVPAGIDITNNAYWAQTGNYNAQIESYRAEVQTFDGRIDALEDALPTSEFDSANTVKAAIDTEATARANAITAEATARTNADNALDGRIDAEVTARTNADNALDGRIDALEAKTEKTEMVVIGDSWSYHDDGSAVPNMWDIQVAKALHLNLHNYARGSVGYSRDRTNCFYDQLVTAANDVDPDTVDRVYIWGGLNDVYRTDINWSSFQTYVASTLQKAAELFPDSYIIVAGIQSYQTGDVRNDLSNYLGFSKIALFTAILSERFSDNIRHGKFINLQNLGYFTTSFFQTNGHPTESGHTNIASKMLGGNVRDNGGTFAPSEFSVNGVYIGRPVLTANNVEYRATGSRVQKLGPNLHSINFTFELPNTDAWGSGNSAEIEMYGFPPCPQWVRLLGVQTGTVVTMNPIWKNSTIQTAAANSQQFSKTFSVPISRANFKDNTIVEVFMIYGD